MNSLYTAGIFAHTFTRLAHVQPSVLYPGVDTCQFRSIPPPPIEPKAVRAVEKMLHAAHLKDIPSGR